MNNYYKSKIIRNIAPRKLKYFLKSIRMEALKAVAREYSKDADYPEFKAGDTITVHYKIKEGNKERIQMFRGVVLQRRGSGITETFTVRKMSNNIGVERIFPIASPFIEKIEINKRGRVRRARIFYLRGLTGKKARIQESRKYLSETAKEKVTKEEPVAKPEQAEAPKQEVVDNQPKEAPKEEVKAEAKDVQPEQKQETPEQVDNKAEAKEQEKPQAEQTGENKEEKKD